MKKALLILLAFVMLLSLCACGNDDTQTADPSTAPSQITTDSTQQTTGSTEGTTEATQAPTDEPTTAPTDEPTTPPTQAPTEAPTAPPTEVPTTPPTTQPATCSHSWKDATCSAPKTCDKCGVTEGSASGHSWNNATCTTPKTCKTCGATEGGADGHSWKDATCSTPKTCSKCGATEGSATGHSWKDASCTAPKTCSKCGATEGSAAGHSWKDATCSAPKTCSVCGTTTGSTAQHTYNTQGKCIYCETLNPVLVNKYEQAVAIVARCTSSAAQSGEDLAKAYKLFVELGDFKDAKEYLSHFSCTAALKQTNQTAVNAFGEPMSPFVADNTRSTYNSLGQLIELYDGFFTIQYTYKENGLLDKEAYKIGGAQNSTSFIVQHIYDANGKETHITRTTSSGDTETRALTYDNNGRLISTYEFTSSLIGSFRYVNYQYDQFNRVIKKTTEIGNDTYEYTYSGDKIDECKISSKNDKYYDVVKYYYDEGRLVKTESTYHSNDGTKGRVITTLYTYGDVYIYCPSK